MAIKRARKQGRTTRHITARAKKTPPMGFGLKVHPQRAVPTPVHPECNTTHMGDYLTLSRRYNAVDFLSGRGLESKHSSCTYKVTRRGAILGKTNDVMYAVAWRRAAHTHDIDDVEVIQA